MAHEIFIRSEAQVAALRQLRALLDENGVQKPHIIWIKGEALLPLTERIGKPPFYKDGPIRKGCFYRYNLCTGRFKEVEEYTGKR